MRSFLVLLALAGLSACDDRAGENAAGAPREAATPAALTFDGAGARDPAAVRAHGERLALVLGCTGCHGENFEGVDWSEPGFGRLWTANLTRVVSGYSDAELARVVQSGRRQDRELWGMPSHLFTQLSRADLDSVIAFLRSKPAAGVVHPAPVFEEGARREIAAGSLTSSAAQVAAEGADWPPDVGPGHELGRYVVRATCAECHGMNLRGGQPNPEAKPRPDLRIAAGYDLSQFMHLLRTGKATGNREVSLMSEVARGRYKHLTDAEIAAVHGYLKAVAETAP